MYSTTSITDKFWILHKLGERIGTIRLNNKVYELIIDGEQKNLSLDDLTEQYGQDILVQTKKVSINTLNAK